MQRGRVCRTLPRSWAGPRRAHDVRRAADAVRVPGVRPGVPAGRGDPRGLRQGARDQRGDLLDRGGAAGLRERPLPRAARARAEAGLREREDRDRLGARAGPGGVLARGDHGQAHPRGRRDAGRAPRARGSDRPRRDGASVVVGGRVRRTAGIVERGRDPHPGRARSCWSRCAPPTWCTASGCRAWPARSTRSPGWDNHVWLEADRAR